MSDETLHDRLCAMASRWPKHSQVQIDLREAADAVALAHLISQPPAANPIKLQHLAVADEYGLRWMSGRKKPDGVDSIELYAMPNFGRAPSVVYAAPTQPSPAEPTDEEICKVAEKHYGTCMTAQELTFARAILAQFTQPPPAESDKESEVSATAGMNLGQRIAHVGGRTNAHGYVEFGSEMAVHALIQHVLRDLKSQPAQPSDITEGLRRLMGVVNAYEKTTGIGGWYAERIQEVCNSISQTAGLGVKFGLGDGRENPLAAQPSNSQAEPSDIDLDRALAMADEHALDSLEDGTRLLDRRGILAFARDVYHFAVDTEMLEDALNTVSWLERRLKPGYGNQQFVQETIARLEKAIRDERETS